MPGAGSKLIPLRSWQSAEEVAALVSYLVSDEGRSITGQTFMVNGGEVMN